MKFLLAFTLACSFGLGDDYPVSAPPDREREGLVGAVREVAEEGEGFRRIKTYDTRGNLVSEGTNFGPWSMGKKYQSLVSGVVSMCYQTVSGVNSVPPPLAPRPIRKPGCGEFYIIEREYRVFPSHGGILPSARATLEELARAGKELAWRAIYIYDSHRRLSEWVEVSAENLTVRRSLYTYKGTYLAPRSYELWIGGRAVLKEWYEYEFDAKGNWVSRRVMKHEPGNMYSIGSGTLKRRITYY